MIYYDEIAEGYEELHKEEQLKKVDIIARAIKVKKDDLLLDVGCGTGITTRLWNCKRIGLDSAIKLLKRAVNGFYVNAEAEHIPFKDKSFDIVISVTAVQNFNDVGRGLKEIKRVAKDRIVISVLKRSEKFDRIKRLIKDSFNIEKEIDEDKDVIFVGRV